MAVELLVCDRFPSLCGKFSGYSSNTRPAHGIEDCDRNLRHAQQGKTKDEFAREFFQHARPSSLIKRFETPDEVAAMVVYLCSEQASATTGSAIRVDGGVVRSIV